MHSRKPCLSNRQRLWVLPVIFFLAVCFVVLFREGLGYLYSQQTVGFLKYWHQEALSEEWDGRIQPTNFINAIEGAERALVYSPDNPFFLGHLVKIHDRQAISGDYFVRNALDIHRKLIRLRPAWPYYRADFAVAKARAGELDDEFEQALKDAMRLGPWEKEVLDKVARLGWLYRSRLGSALQNKIDKNLARYVSAYPRDVIRWGHQEGHLPQLCLIFTDLARFGSCRYIIPILPQA